MVRKQNRLRALEVRVARHDDALVENGALHQGTLHFAREFDYGINFIAAPEAHVSGHLIVSAARRVKLRAGRADAFRQGGLDVHVNVLEFLTPSELAQFNVGLDTKQSIFNRFEFLRGENARFGQRLGMGDGAPDVMGVKPVIEGHRFPVAPHERAGGFGETAFPHGEHET